MVSLLPSFLPFSPSCSPSLSPSLSLPVSRRGLSRAQPAVKLKNFRAFCGPPDESPGVHADWLDYRLGFETHQTDRKICRLHNSARLVRTYVRACVRAYAYARRDTGTYTRSSTHVHTSVHASRARARAEYVTPRRAPRPVAFTTRKLCPSIGPILLFLSFFLSFPRLAFFFSSPRHSAPCSIFYEAPSSNAISRKPPPLSFSPFLFQPFRF